MTRRENVTKIRYSFAFLSNMKLELRTQIHS